MIRSMEEFLMVLPLIEDHVLADFLYRVTGEPNGTYLDDKLDDLWELIPESPSKIYVESYFYFHMLAPTVEQCETLKTEEAVQKLETYRGYRKSRRFQEEQRAYLTRLNEFRDKLKHR